MKIKSIIIDEYKILKDISIDFVDKNEKILELIVLAGVNGSGKTTILEFIDNYKKLVNNNQYVEFYGLDDGKNIVYLKAEEGNSNLKNSIIKYIRRKIFKEKISPSETYKSFNNFIHSIFTEFPEFHGLDEEENIYFINNLGKEILIDNLSTGERRLLEKVIYFFIEDIKNSVILIDEPETSLHPSWQNKLIKIYKNLAINYNNQIIIATHSPNIIASTPNDSLFILNKTDKIEIKKYNAYGKDINGIISEIMGSEIRDSEVNLALSNIKKLIFENKFEEAKNEIDNLDINDNIEIGLLKLELGKRIAKY